jgi:hypothetical protein
VHCDVVVQGPEPLAATLHRELPVLRPGEDELERVALEPALRVEVVLLERPHPAILGDHVQPRQVRGPGSGGLRAPVDRPRRVGPARKIGRRPR